MTFACFDTQVVQDAIKRLSESPHLSVFVGAGISAEAGMPPWAALIEGLLTEASSRVFGADTEAAAAWVERTMLVEQAPGAAGIAETLLGDDLAEVLRRHLYPRENDWDLAEFAPGPTAHAVADLRSTCDELRCEHGHMKILTTNYDDLLELALRAQTGLGYADVQSVAWRNPQVRAAATKVFHLHGLLTPTEQWGDLTLTDTSFYRTSEVSRARDEFVTRVLSETNCLFLGTSFSDPNLMRFIYRSAQMRSAAQDDAATPRHVALLTHHSDDPEEVIQVRERIARARLSDASVDCVFLEHYGDVSQFVREVRNQIVGGATGPQYQVRVRRVIEDMLDGVLHTTATKAVFQKAQEHLSRSLQLHLRTVVEALDNRAGSQLGTEALAAKVWLLSRDGKVLIPWLASDKILRDPDLVTGADVCADSPWYAVQAVCEGKVVSSGMGHLVSRWRHVVGAPLRVRDGATRGRVAVGALTLTTLSEPSETWLRRITAPDLQRLTRELTDAVADLLESAE